MHLDHVGVRVDSLTATIDAHGSEADATVKLIPGVLGEALWGRPTGDLRVWFHHDTDGSTEYFEQLDRTLDPLPDTHLCLRVDSVTNTLAWWESLGFTPLGVDIVTIGAKQTVMLRSADETIVQLVSHQNEDHKGE